MTRPSPRIPSGRPCDCLASHRDGRGATAAGRNGAAYGVPATASGPLRDLGEYGQRASIRRPILDRDAHGTRAKVAPH